MRRLEHSVCALRWLFRFWTQGTSCTLSFDLVLEIILSRMHSSHLRFFCAFLFLFFSLVSLYSVCIWILLLFFFVYFFNQFRSLHSLSDWWIKQLSFVDETSSLSLAHASIVCAYGFGKRSTFTDSFYSNLRTHRLAIGPVWCVLTKCKMNDNKNKNKKKTNQIKVNKTVWKSLLLNTIFRFQSKNKRH